VGWIRRLRRSFSVADDDFDEEARFHIDERTEEYIRQGLSPDGARRAAKRRFGSVTVARDRTADTDMFRWVDDLRRDLGYGFRTLSRSPGFALLAVLCLTLGIGANAAVFSWIEGILLRPYPLVVDQYRLYAVVGTERGSTSHTDMSWPDWLDVQRSSTLVDSFIAEKITGTTLSVGDRAERAPGSVVSANYFDAIGVHPVLGRGFLPGEDAGRNAHPVTVISYQAWQDRYHGDPTIIGKTQMLNGLPHTIVGVAPEGFYGTFVGYAFQFWVPASMQAQFSAGVYKLEDRGARWIEGFVRLKPGVTIDQAQTELSAIMSRLGADYPETNRGRGIRLFPLWRTPFNNAGAMVPTLGVALGVVLAVLLIACANVANLLLLRAFARQQEMTIRLSIGAGRARLVRQMLTEGLLLSAIAAAAGFAIALWLRDALAFLTPPRGGIVLRLPGELDWRVFVAGGAVCVAATLLFALLPALVTSHVDLAGALRAHAGSLVGSRRTAWVRSALVIVQIALSVVLLVGAGLLIRSFQAIRTADPGFRTEGVLTTSVDAFAAGYDARRARVFQDELIDRVRAIGGVESAEFSTTTPFSYASVASAPIAVDGYVPPPDLQPTAEYNIVGPDYFSTLGIPIVSGRAFAPADDEGAAPVAIVDQAMAEQFWRGGDTVGSRVRVRNQWRLVVGVARSIKSRNLMETPRPFFLHAAASESCADGRSSYSDSALTRGARPGSGSRDSRDRREHRAGRTDHTARAGRADDGIPADRNDNPDRVRRIGAAAGGGWAVRGHGGDSRARCKATRAADGARRRCVAGPAPRPHARTGYDSGGRAHRRGRRVRNDAAPGLLALSGQPARSLDVQCRGRDRCGCGAGRVHRACAARNANGSHSGVASVSIVSP
jgi:macrolide transport system ATP-binding/permease protein